MWCRCSITADPEGTPGVSSGVPWKDTSWRWAFRWDCSRTMPMRWGGLTTDTWATRVWRELQEHQMHLAHRGPDVQLHRKQDGFLTQIFLDLGFEGDTLERLNWCRMFLHATCLSDLSNAAGTHLKKEAWEGRRGSHRPSVGWPRLKRPLRAGGRNGGTPSGTPWKIPGAQGSACQNHWGNGRSQWTASGPGCSPPHGSCSSTKNDTPPGATKASAVPDA